MDVYSHLEQIAREAELAVMGHVLSILHDRETVSEERLRALTAGDVADLYDRFVGPAVDSIEDALKGAS